MDHNLHIVIFECCRIVNGKRNAIICDIQRGNILFITLIISELISENNKCSIISILEKYDESYHIEILETINKLESDEYIFFTNYPSHFPEMSMDWDEPTPITNGIIDLSKNILHFFPKIWEDLGLLGCEHIQIRGFESFKLSEIESILNLIGENRIISIELLLVDFFNLSDAELIAFVYRQPRIFTLILHSSFEQRSVFISPTGMGHVSKLFRTIDSKYHCGKISTDLFHANMKSFTESLDHNSCLNRKISIDSEGNIKNCPSMTKTYGNIRDTNLADAMEKPGFKDLWDINKDKIHVCKDCEFRYICTDCRAYIEDPADIFSKPLKCGYNPYTGEWSEWSTNPLKQKAIDFYGMRDILPKVDA